MMKIQNLLIPACLLTAIAGVIPAVASPAFSPLQSSARPVSPIVDEPLGARSSLGLTLWHMGHDPQKISEFHSFLQNRKVKIGSLLRAKTKAPTSTRRILIEPERLPTEQLTGWLAQGEYLASGSADAGPEVNMPLRIERAGLYRGWVRFFGWTNGTAVTSLRIYRKGREAQGPIINDEIYDYAVEKEGLQWKSFMVDLAAGDYVVQLGHVTRWWHAGAGPGNYNGRQMDLLYFTDELWREAPSDEILKALRATAPATTLQMNAQPALSPTERTAWQNWQVRPLSWEDAASQPRLFGLSREFWRGQIDAIGKKDYGTTIPDYRVPERQVVFDDVWNLAANPVQIRRRIEMLNGDLIATPSPHFSYWVRARDFQIDGGWEKNANNLGATYGDFGGVAQKDLTVERPGEYSVWVHFGGPPGYFSPWQTVVSAPGGQKINYAHTEKIRLNSQWGKVGVVKMNQAGKVHFEITPLGFKDPGTYRNIYDFLLTTDANYTPLGSVHPPITLAQYAAQARNAGATEKDSYLAWLFKDAYTPLSQEVWDANTWPAPLAKGQVAPPMRQDLVMASDTRRAVQVGLRNLRGTPVTLKVSGGALRGAAGDFPGKVNWRVVTFVPATEAARDWTPFIVLRRASVTIPPRNVAGVWLTVDTTGVAPGNYTSQVVFEGKGSPKRTVTLQVNVRAKVSPQKPILIGGWTQTPEGEVYRRDYVAHGMNIWYGDMSKAEMKQRGIEMLITTMWTPDEAAIRAVIDRFKGLGLDYSDWMFSVLDEPSGTTEEALKPYIDIAKAIRRVDPQVRISFNPGEAATLPTFQILDPYCDFWLPYTHHRTYHPNEAEAKRAIFTVKPWMWYTTPDLYEERPSYPGEIYDQIRSVPSQPGNVVGTAFFAFYYPFRDAWDTAHEHFPDVGITVMPSRHGPVATRAWEAIGESSQHANLAQALKERAGANVDAATQKLIAEGTVAQLLANLGRKR